MTDDQRIIALQQLANIVIDAYLDRDQQFTPQFDPCTQAVMYLVPPESYRDQHGLRTNVWYERSDYEESVTPREQKAQRTAQK